MEDARLNPRFATNLFVTGESCIRFDTGAPLVASTGHAVGTLCVLDRRPRTVTEEKLNELRFLARQVITAMERSNRDTWTADGP